MKVLLVGKDTTTVGKLAAKLGFELVKQNPQVVISYGGDGTLLYAERLYPGIPKLPLRNSRICKKCPDHEDEVVLKKLTTGKLKLREYTKLETEILYKKFYALNDFVIRNYSPIHTIRFKITPLKNKLLIGDGVAIATVFGSTGYFKSISHQTFGSGFGVAFNNTTEKTSPLILKDDAWVRFKLVRGKATLSFDNNPDIFTLDEGSEVIFRLSDQVARIYEAESLRCPNCQITRD